MFALFVTVKIKDGHRDEFIAATKGDAEGSNTAEPGCLRFDVLADNNDPNTVYLYEVYESRDAWETAHRGMPHYTKWRETVVRLVRRRPAAHRNHPPVPQGGLFLARMATAAAIPGTWRPFPPRPSSFPPRHRGIRLPPSFPRKRESRGE